MSTITPTPSGMVEVGNDFWGNVPQPGNAFIETGMSFQGSQPQSTPTPAGNQKISKGDSN